MIYFMFYRIGSEERPNFFKTAAKTPIPGPGTYETKSALSGPKFSMRAKVEKLGETLPGPGAYEPKHKFDASIRSSPSYS